MEFLKSVYLNSEQWEDFSTREMGQLIDSNKDLLYPGIEDFNLPPI